MREELVLLLKPIVESLGYLWWGCVLLSPQGQSLLRVYIDRPEGVCIEDCEKVSRQLSAVLDVENFLTQGYTLEVSSPGLDRPLFNLEQYASVLGQKIFVQLKSPLNQQRKFTGALSAVNTAGIVLLEETGPVEIPAHLIDRAQVVPQWSSPKNREKPVTKSPKKTKNFAK